MLAAVTDSRRAIIAFRWDAQHALAYERGIPSSEPDLLAVFCR
jgi:hypothetical protein